MPENSRRGLDSEFVTVGKAVKPHGIRGEFRMKNYADSPSLFDVVDAVYLRSGKGRPKKYVVHSWRNHQGMVLMQLKGVDDRDKAEALRDMEILVRADALPQLEDDEYYLHELEGASVELEDGTYVGVLDGFIETPGQEVWSIRTEDGNELLLPAVPEFVVDFDSESRVLTIDPPEGLFDLYLKSE